MRGEWERKEKSALGFWLYFISLYDRCTKKKKKGLILFSGCGGSKQQPLLNSQVAWAFTEPWTGMLECGASLQEF